MVTGYVTDVRAITLQDEKCVLNVGPVRKITLNLPGMQRSKVITRHVYIDQAD